MSKKLYEEDSVRAIANAIREKNGEETSYKVSQMAQAILDIDGGTGDMPNLDLVSFGNNPVVDNPGYTDPRYYEDIADAINYAIEHGGGVELPEVSAYSQSASQLISISHTLASGKHTVIVVTTSYLTLADIELTLNGEPLTLATLRDELSQNLRGLAYANIDANVGELVLSSSRTVGNSGANLIVITGEYTPELTGASQNDGAAINIQDGLSIFTTGYGYYSGSNVFDGITVVNKNGQLKISSPGNSTYWYGGIYSIKLN